LVCGAPRILPTRPVGVGVDVVAELFEHSVARSAAARVRKETRLGQDAVGR